MRIENEAQAVSEARKLLNEEHDSPSEAIYNGKALARWVVTEHEKRRRADEQQHPKKHVVVICRTYAEMTAWARDELHIAYNTHLSVHSQLHALYPGGRNAQLRGLPHDRVAIVDLDPNVTVSCVEDLEILTDLKRNGAKQYAQTDHVLIRQWLGIKPPLHGRSA
jgi:hypothetical protein